MRNINKLKRKIHMENLNVIGIDLAKNVFQLHGASPNGSVVFRKQLKRHEVLPFLAQRPKCTIAMEACGGCHYWAREIKTLGHEVKIIAPHFVKPFVKRQKNDRNDAEAITEAASRKNMPLVSMKSVSVQDIQSTLRIRERCVRQRTALVNQMRGLLMEYGEIIPQGREHVLKHLPDILANEDNKLTYYIRLEFESLMTELLDLNERINTYEQKLDRIYTSNELCQRLAKIRGIGPITAVSVLTELDDPAVYKNGRHFAAFLGLVPRQNSSGGKAKLEGISKQGNRHIRYLLIHGARAVLAHVDKKEDRLSCWLKELKAKHGMNKAAVALANKNARIVWSLARHGDSYQAS